jgi:hypothetical protein
VVSLTSSSGGYINGRNSANLELLIDKTSSIQKGKTCYFEEQVISMLEFLIDNILVSFGGTLFQQVVGIPIWFMPLPRYTPLPFTYVPGIPGISSFTSIHNYDN